MLEATAAVVLLVVAAAFRWYGWRSQGALFEFARDRRCSKCGKPVKRKQMVAVVLEDGTTDASRAINRCPFGELTMFDRAGAERYVYSAPPVDEAATSHGDSRPPRPAIGLTVPILVGALGCAFVIVACVLASDETWIVPFVPLALGLLCLAVLVFATGPPPDARADWGRVRYDRARRIQFVAGWCGVLGIGVTYSLSRMGVADDWTSVLQTICGVLVAVAYLMKFAVAYYRHYADQAGR